MIHKNENDSLTYNMLRKKKQKTWNNSIDEQPVGDLGH